jgi:hypothetical protein
LLDAMRGLSIIRIQERRDEAHTYGPEIFEKPQALHVR